MRSNKYVAQATGLSRRAADRAIENGRVTINGNLAMLGSDVPNGAIVTLDRQSITLRSELTTIMLYKPIGYVVSRTGQGSRTVYDLLPPDLHHLKPVGRLDKDSSGLLLMTDDGGLANELTHPSHQKRKVYEVSLNKPLQPLHRQLVNDHGIDLDDGRSQLQLERLTEGNDYDWLVTMQEGRNRQIRRTFAALGYTIVRLHRVSFGKYVLENITVGMYTTIH